MPCGHAGDHGGRGLCSEGQPAAKEVEKSAQTAEDIAPPMLLPVGGSQVVLPLGSEKRPDNLCGRLVDVARVAVLGLFFSLAPTHPAHASVCPSPSAA